MHKHPTLKTLIVALAGAAALAACSDSPQAEAVAPPGNTVPASATASTGAWLSYTASLPANDMAAPLDVNGVTPPTSETEESRPL